MIVFELICDINPKKSSGIIKSLSFNRIRVKYYAIAIKNNAFVAINGTIHLNNLR